MPGKSGERAKRGRETGAAAEDATVGAIRPLGSGQPLIDLEFVRGLIAAVDESGIDSLEINRAGTRIKISKSPAPVVVSGGVVPSSIPASPVAAPVPAAAAPAAGGASSAAAEAPAAPAAPATEAPRNLIEVKSPMVGTFYRAPAPEAPPYVEVGSTVSKGQTLCILEAMKLMNELESEVDGIVREILVANAEPVEYGQVLFRIEPTAS